MHTGKQGVSGRRIPTALILAAAAAMLVACGRSGQPAPAPAAATVTPARVATATPPAAVAPAPATHSAAPAPTSAPTAAAPAAATTAGPESAGSVALAAGSVTDRATDGSTRQLKDGDTVYPGDAFSLGDASYLDLDLEDGGRILLRPDTSFQIQEYHFDPDAHPAAGEQIPPASLPQTPESAFFNLLKGGLRAVDGLIGQTNHQNYGINTPVATIGVRGTAFDVRYCGDDCKDEADASGAPKNGLYTAVSDGSIAVKNDAGETVTKAGEYSFVQTRKAVAQRVDHAPRALRHMSLPPALNARADKNRQLIRQKRQARRQQVLEQRRQQAAGKQGEIPAERRQQRMQQQGRQEDGRQRRGQENRQPGAGDRQRPEPAQQPGRRDQQQRTTPESRPQYQRERQQEMQRRREERQAGKAGEQRQLKREQQKKGGCKGKKRRKKRGNPGGCGG